MSGTDVAFARNQGRTIAGRSCRARFYEHELWLLPIARVAEIFSRERKLDLSPDARSHRPGSPRSSVIIVKAEYYLPRVFRHVREDVQSPSLLRGIDGIL